MKTTYVAKLRVDDFAHFGYTPFDDIAKVLVVDVEVLPTNGALRTLLQLVLTVSTARGSDVARTRRDICT